MEVLIFSVLKIGGILLALYFARKRVQAWRRKTEEMGFRFSDKADKGFVQELSAFKMFKKVKPKSILNLMRASANQLHVAMFDFYSPQSGIRATAIYFRGQALELPRFALRPESMWHRLLKKFGYADIDFESHENFSRRYLLRGDDDEAIRGVFFDDVLNYFENNPGLYVHGIADRLIIFRSAKHVEPEKLRDFLQEGFRVYDLFRTPTAADEDELEFELELDDELAVMAEELGI